MNASSPGPLTFRPVTDKNTVNDFVRVPWSLYRNDPHWTPPLILERKDVLAPKHPIFRHLQWQAWVGYRDNIPVARISAQIDQLHLDRHEDETGFFGFIECVDDSDAFRQLTALAEDWCRERGMKHMRGPFSFNINQEVGLLVDGFDSPPYIMMTHARPYYGPRLVECGYQKARDMFAYLINANFQPPPVMASLFERLRRKVSFRALNRKCVDDELEKIRDVFNDAWSDNWGFVPFTAEEFRAIGREMLMIIPDDFIQIAEMNGEVVAFIVLLPNINECIADLNGRLLPFGWVKLISRLKFGYPKTARIPLMGVRKRFHHTRLGPGLAMSVVESLREPGLRKGLETVEMSWILEDNEAMINIIETLGGTCSKRYRVFEKPL